MGRSLKRDTSLRLPKLVQMSGVKEPGRIKENLKKMIESDVSLESVSSD